MCSAFSCSQCSVCVTQEDRAPERDDSAATRLPWGLTLLGTLLIRRLAEPHSAAVPPEPCGRGWKDADAAIKGRGEGGRGAGRCLEDEWTNPGAQAAPARCVPCGCIYIEIGVTAMQATKISFQRVGRDFIPEM